MEKQLKLSQAVQKCPKSSLNQPHGRVQTSEGSWCHQRHKVKSSFHTFHSLMSPLCWTPGPDGNSSSPVWCHWAATQGLAGQERGSDPQHDLGWKSPLRPLGPAPNPARVPKRHRVFNTSRDGEPKVSHPAEIPHGLQNRRGKHWVLLLSEAVTLPKTPGRQHQLDECSQPLSRALLYHHCPPGLTLLWGTTGCKTPSSPAWIKTSLKPQVLQDQQIQKLTSFLCYTEFFHISGWLGFFRWELVKNAR